LKKGGGEGFRKVLKCYIFLFIEGMAQKELGFRAKSDPVEKRS
jgi:hypothetical protein